LRHGRASLAIGFSFVAVCLIAADAVGKFATGNFSTILRESLTIVGWVAMWRPMQIFLYDWWPLRLEFSGCQNRRDCAAWRARERGRAGSHMAGHGSRV
jgi:hypothetical protein